MAQTMGAASYVSRGIGASVGAMAVNYALGDTPLAWAATPAATAIGARMSPYKWAAAAIACSDSQVISHEVTRKSSGAKLDGCSLGEFHCSA